MRHATGELFGQRSSLMAQDIFQAHNILCVVIGKHRHRGRSAPVLSGPGSETAAVCPAKSATPIMSDSIDRSAASRTDSELASSASLAIWSVAQAARWDIRPTAWSRLPRRSASISARTSDSLARRWAVRAGTSLALAHSAHDSSSRQRGGRDRSGGPLVLL